MTPQDVAAQIASKAAAMFRQLKVPILGILENMSAFVCPHCGTRSAIFKQGGGRRASELLGVPLLAEIPLDPVVCQASDRGRTDRDCPPWIAHGGGVSQCRRGPGGADRCGGDVRSGHSDESLIRMIRDHDREICAE